MVKPTQPTDFMLKLLECDTGIRARELFYAKLDGNIISINRGFRTNITRGYLVSQPSERDINGYSIAFTPPDFKLRAKDSNQDSFVEEQAAHGKMSDETLRILTSYTAKYPKDYNKLRHFVKKIEHHRPPFWYRLNPSLSCQRCFETCCRQREELYPRLHRQIVFWGFSN